MFLSAEAVITKKLSDDTSILVTGNLCPYSDM